MLQTTFDRAIQGGQQTIEGWITSADSLFGAYEDGDGWTVIHLPSSRYMQHPLAMHRPLVLDTRDAALAVIHVLDAHPAVFTPVQPDIRQAGDALDYVARSLGMMLAINQ